jgi:serine/threonine protein kinase
MSLSLTKNFLSKQVVVPVGELNLDLIDFSEFSMDNVDELGDVERIMTTIWRMAARRINFYLQPNCLFSPADIVRCALGYGISSDELIERRMDQAFEKIRRQPYNHVLLDELACLVQSLAKIKSEPEPREADVIGTGSFGAAICGVLPSRYDPIEKRECKEPAKYITKIAFRNSLELMNEVITGIYATNAFRPIIPNFAVVLGSYFARRPRVVDLNYGKKDEDSDYTIDKLFSDEGRTLHLMLENIPNAPTFEGWIRELSRSNGTSVDARRTYEIIVQILLSLAFAREQCNFSHGDIHPPNVLLRFIPERRTITYPINGTTYHVVTDVIATIIDYGQSHALVPFPCEKQARELALMSTRMVEEFIEENPGHILGELYRSGHDMNAIVKTPKGPYLRTGYIFYQLNMSYTHPASLYDCSRFLAGTIVETQKKTRWMKVNGQNAIGMEWFGNMQSSKQLLRGELLVDWFSRTHGTPPAGVDINILELFESGIMGAIFNCRNFGLELEVFKGELPESSPPRFSCEADDCNPSISEDEIIQFPSISSTLLAEKGHIPLDPARTPENVREFTERTMEVSINVVKSGKDIIPRLYSIADRLRRGKRAALTPEQVQTVNATLASARAVIDMYKTAFENFELILKYESNNGPIMNESLDDHFKYLIDKRKELRNAIGKLEKAMNMQRH